MPSTDTQPDDVGSKPIAVEEPPKSHRALSRLQRELREEELSSPGVQKLLLDYLAQADDEIAALKSFRNKFHEADKNNGVLQERLKTSKAAEAISMSTLALGGALLGFAPTLSVVKPAALIAIAFGSVLILVGVLAKVVRQ